MSNRTSLRRRPQPRPKCFRRARGQFLWPRYSPETGASLTGAAAPETVEHAGELLRWNTGAGVVDDDQKFVLPPLSAERDRALLGVNLIALPRMFEST